MADVTYEIADWDKYFENAESRKVKSLAWVPMPNRHDGGRFRAIIERKNGDRVYAAWCLMVQLASRSKPRGLLADEHGPFTPRRLAMKTGCPAATFEHAIGVLSEPEISWIVPASPETSGHPRKLPDVPGKNSVEGKGREGKGIETTNVVSPATPGAEKKPRSEKLAERDALWDAVVAEWGLPVTTKTQQSRVGKLVSEFKGAGAVPSEIAVRRKRILDAWGVGKDTPESVVKHWGEFDGTSPSATRVGRIEAAPGKYDAVMAKARALGKADGGRHDGDAELAFPATG